MLGLIKRTSAEFRQTVGDKEYSTNKSVEHTFVMGSSMGGLISLYALCEYPEVFGGAACIYDIRNPLTLLAHKKMPLPRHFFISLTNPQP